MESPSPVQEPPNIPPALVEKPIGLPPGKYKLVGWDVVSTGRRLIDEMCQITAYIPPRTKYCQYIMPHGDLNPGARRRNHMRVINIGRHRMLKDTYDHKVFKTKSEVTALVGFLNWLEAHKEKDEKILLMYHDPRRLHPKAILVGIIRHQLFERFSRIVAGFTDSYALCNAKCLGSLKSVSLHILTKLLLDEKSQSVATAMDRAKATYRVIEQLAYQGEALDIAAGGGGAGTATYSEMMEFAIEFARPVHSERSDLEAMQNLLERQNTYRCVMRPLLRGSRSQRRRITQLRRALAEAGLLYYQFKDAWHEGRRDGLVRLLSPLEEIIKAEGIEELLNIFETHFESHQETRDLSSAEDGPEPGTEDSVSFPPEEFYFSSDSESPEPMPSSSDADRLVAALSRVKNFWEDD